MGGAVNTRHGMHIARRRHQDSSFQSKTCKAAEIRRAIALPFCSRDGSCPSADSFEPLQSLCLFEATVWNLQFPEISNWLHCRRGVPKSWEVVPQQLWLSGPNSSGQPASTNEMNPNKPGRVPLVTRCSQMKTTITMPASLDGSQHWSSSETLIDTLHHRLWLWPQGLEEVITRDSWPWT